MGVTLPGPMGDSPQDSGLRPVALPPIMSPISRVRQVTEMQWASTVSEAFNLRDAVAEASAHIKAELGDAPPDLVVAFVSPHHAPDYEDLSSFIAETLAPRHVLGCSGGGVIGGAREVEERTGLSLTAAGLPGIEIVPFHVEQTQMPDLDAGPNAWESVIGVSPETEPHFVLLADPFSFPSDALLAGLDYSYPQSTKIGGLASGGHQPGSNALYLDGALHRSGAVGVALHGDIQVDTIVAQGCRPIGRTHVVTKCQQNILLEVDESKPLDALREIFEASEDRDRQLINSALHLGVVTDPLLEEFGPGDFLIRNVLGMQRETGGLVIGEMLREGQVVQFHVRDAQTAAEDLETLLREYRAGHEGVSGAGALLFSCLGRGKNLFGRPDHDTDLFIREVGETPLGGFFCNGEIGPVGATTFLHGFTSSFGIFRPRED